MKTALCFCVHDDVGYLPQCLDALRMAPTPPPAGHRRATRAAAPAVETPPAFVFVSRQPWHAHPGDWQTAAAACEALGATVVLGDWQTEQSQRQAAIEHLRALGHTHALIPDGDEIIEPALLHTLLTVAENGLADRVYVHWDTYWKTPEYVIRPRERFTPCYLIDMRVARPTGGRNFEGGRALLLGPEYGIVHHLSWVGPEARIRRKIETWGHATEVLPTWYDHVWRLWDINHSLQNLHPTHPEAYGFAERIHVPDLLAPALARYRELAEAQAPDRTPLPVPKNWPGISVVIPVHGGAEDLAACLGGLTPLVAEGLVAKVVVVDNGSEAGEIKPAIDLRHPLTTTPSITVLRNPTNTGFAHACNQGAECGAIGRAECAAIGRAECAAIGRADAAGATDHLLFLNSDAILTRAGLIRMVESLGRSGAIGAVGPWTNNAGHGQQIAVTYTTTDNLDLFAEDFAARDAEDVDRDMLVGFCLLVRRSVWEEVKDPATGAGFDERFGLGTFEDNDLCYRIRRSGYRLVLSGRAFVHHAGSRTLRRVGGDIAALLETNRRKYLAKWRDDLEAGFANTLSGISDAQLVFTPARHPDIRLRRARQRALLADISLIMIVKDEERVLGDCLRSAKPFFKEIIVVDTGSSDRTRQIAVDAGARVFDFPWTNSFSEARNESLRHATGRWIFWCDADDTLPWSSGEAILDAALNARPEVCAFVVPVQFVEANVAPAVTHSAGTTSGQGGGDVTAFGTRVDHVKLFRNLPGLEFTGRIHEQILPSLRAVAAGAGQAVISRCPAVVMHTGYDNTPEGQAKKHIRDTVILGLELQDWSDNPFTLFNLGMTDHHSGYHEDAIYWLRRSVANGPPGGYTFARKSYALIVLSLESLGLEEEALRVVEEGLAAVGDDDAELHFRAAVILTRRGEYAAAKAHYEKTLAADPSNYFSSFDVGILGHRTHFNLGQVCTLMGDYAGAREWWLKSVATAPQFLPSAVVLFHSAIEKGDLPTAHAMLAHVESQDGRSETWAQMGARLAAATGSPGVPSAGAAGGDGNAELAFLRAAASGGETGPRLELTRRLLSTGQEAEALPHLAALSERGVAEGAYCLGVSAYRRGDLAGALRQMERALELNPGHDPTRKQVAALRAALGSPPIPDAKGAAS